MAAAVAMIHEMMSSRKRDKAKIACDLWEDEDETGRVRAECKTLQRRGTCIITNMGASKKLTTLNYFMQTAIGILFFYFPFFWGGSGSTWCSGKSSGNSKQPGA